MNRLSILIIVHVAVISHSIVHTKNKHEVNYYYTTHHGVVYGALVRHLELSEHN